MILDGLVWAKQSDTTRNPDEIIASASTDADKAEASAVSAKNSELTASEAAVLAQQAAATAQRVLDSLPEDYDELSNKVENLTTELAESLEGKYYDDAYVEEGYLILKKGDEASRLGPFAGGGGSGGGGGSSNNATMTIRNTSGWLSKTVAYGGKCPVSFEWSSLEEDIETGNGTCIIRVNNTVKATLDVAQGEVTIELTKYLVAGTNRVKVSVTDVYENTRTITYTITASEISLSSEFDSTQIFTAGETVPYTYTPVGALSKTVFFYVDGKLIGRDTVTASNRQVTYSLPAMAHGSHTLLVYFTVVIDDTEVTSNELFYDLIVVDSTSDVPVIAMRYNTTEATQYNSIYIPYTVYTPNRLNSEVYLYVNGVNISKLTVDRTEQTWTYRPETVGEVVLKLGCGVTEKILTLDVAESDIKIAAETDALALYLTSRGRTNTEENPEVWEYKTISAQLEGFNFVSNGWIADANGDTALHVTGDARVTIPYQPFAKDFRTTGKTIELEFATSSVLNYDAVLLSCMDGTRGFQLTAQRATLSSEQSVVSTQYKENEHVRIAFVCEKRSENRLLYIYINGIMSGVVLYPTDDDFSQPEPQYITIGSNECTIDVYNIRIYDNNLNRYQVLNNWIADTPNADDMFDRYNRNDVYDDYGDIVISTLPKDLPYLVMSCEELPQYKGDKKTISGYYVDPNDTSKSFTYTGAEANVQGTSSQYYPRKNYKIKFKKGFIMQSGETSSTFAMRSNSIPTNAFTFKADVASSEGANNVELVRLYNDACPYQTPAQVANPKVRQGIDGFPIVIFWDNGTDVTFVGKYNFNNDKGTEEVFGFVEGDESWEVKNNTSNRVLWKSADYSGTDWLNDFEGRYPEDYDDPTNLAAFANWIVSTDTTAADGKILNDPVTYEGVEYTADTAEYRLAKFKAELNNWVELDSCLFYYLFTELFLMVDSRAKNMFPSFMGEEV